MANPFVSRGDWGGFFLYLENVVVGGGENEVAVMIWEVTTRGGGCMGCHVGFPSF
jgi:hypothetical protein